MCLKMKNETSAQVVRSGSLLKIASLRSEFVNPVGDIDNVIDKFKRLKTRADLFTFVTSPFAQEPSSSHKLSKSSEAKAVLEIGEYDHWWTKQINDKTRNMVRKARKKGVRIEVTKFDDKLVSGIHEIYNETPIRQGRRYGHYGMSLSKVREANGTFEDRSDYIGAWLDDELIGFAKMVDCGSYSMLMQIVSKLSHRNKSPTNALLAKAVELCSERNRKHLMYGMWSRGTLGDFKVKHGFKKVLFPRYYLPLNPIGSISLKLKLNESIREKIIDRLPENKFKKFISFRTKVYLYLNRSKLKT